MNPHTRQLPIFIISFFTAGLVHSLLPPGSLWIRAAITGASAMVMFGLLYWLLPRPPRPPAG